MHLASPILSTTIAALILAFGAAISRAEETRKADATPKPAQAEKKPDGAGTPSQVTSTARIIGGAPGNQGEIRVVAPNGNAPAGGVLQLRAAPGGAGNISIEAGGPGSGRGQATVKITNADGSTHTQVIELGDQLNAGIEAIPSTYLGIEMDDVPQELATKLSLAQPASGVLVKGVAEGSPAASAGLQKDDVVVKVGAEDIANPDQLRKVIAGHKSGDTVHITYLRNGVRGEMDAKLTNRNLAPQPAGTIRLNGGEGGAIFIAPAPAVPQEGEPLRSNP